ncbi:MAG: hypothetical protein P8J44_08620 [Gammaproteobacteria bacterium]|nr:hypothetical protein [Gammaproteobacteria bacterium]
MATIACSICINNDSNIRKISRNIGVFEQVFVPFSLSREGSLDKQYTLAPKQMFIL